MTNQVKPGIFIVFEGADGSGKSTQLKFLADTLTGLGYKVLTTREPGGTNAAEEIRNVLLNPRKEVIQPLTEVLLFAASRLQHVETVIKPALAQGYIVISDRFTDSSYAYQACGRGMMDEFLAVEQLVLKGFRPDVVLFFDIPIEVSLARLALRTGKSDRLDQEGLDFKLKVFSGYLRRTLEHAATTVVINANQPVVDVRAEVAKWVSNSGLFPTKNSGMGQHCKEALSDGQTLLPTPSLYDELAAVLPAGSYNRQAPTKLGGEIKPIWAYCRTLLERIPLKQITIRAKSSVDPDAPSLDVIYRTFNRRKDRMIRGEFGQPNRDHTFQSNEAWYYRVMCVDEKRMCVVFSNPRLSSPDCADEPGKEVLVILDAQFDGPYGSIAAKLIDAHPDEELFKYRMLISEQGPAVLVTWDFVLPQNLNKGTTP